MHQKPFEIDVSLYRGAQKLIEMHIALAYEHEYLVHIPN